MATVYGGWIATDDYRARLDYTVTARTDTTATVSLSVYMSTGVGYNNSASGYGRLTCGSTSNTSGGKAWAANTNTLMLSKSYTINRTHSTQSITLKGAVWSTAAAYNSATSTASATLSVNPKTSYKVTFNANGGSGAPSAQTKWYGESLTLSSTKPTRSGYNFLGWSTSKTATSANSSYAPGKTYTSNAALTLYAVWQQATFAVTYNGNGSTGGSTAAQTKTYGTALTLRSNGFTRTGYNFVRWNTKANGTGTSYNAGASYTANAALTLYAQWSAIQYTVAYNANGGSGAPASQTKNYGTALTLSSAVPTWAGHTFVGWGTSATATSVSYRAGASYTANAAITLYAIWTCTISYNANGGTGAPGAQTKYAKTNITISTTKPTRAGYDFKGWATSATSTTVAYASGATYSSTSGATLYAVWAASAPTLAVTNSTRVSWDEDENAYVLDDEGTVARVLVNYSVSSATSISSWAVTVNGVTANAPAESTASTATFYVVASLSPFASYTVTATLTDSGGTTNRTNTVTRTDGITVATAVMDFHAGGDGVAFGRLAASGGFACAWPAVFEGSLEAPAIGHLASSIAGVEQTTATANHAKGSYFMLGNVLMCATAAIATGEQITTSNATPATIQAQIDNIRRSVLRTITDASSVSCAGFITGDDSLVAYVPLPNADQYTTITVTPVAARGPSGIVFNVQNLPTAYRVQNKSALGCEVVFTQSSPSSANRYKAIVTELRVSAS